MMPTPILAGLLDFAPTKIPSDGDKAISVLAQNFEKIFLALAVPLALVALLYTGYILITSAGKPEAYKKAKQNFSYVIIGIFIIVFANVMVRFVIGLLT